MLLVTFWSIYQNSTANDLSGMLRRAILVSRFGVRSFGQSSRWRQISASANRAYSVENGIDEAPQSDKSGRYSRLAMRVVGAAVIGVGLWWFYWPHHTFPSSVATILRKGLWQETEKFGKNYHRGLQYYRDALKECDKLGVDPLSDEYTGIEIKIAEMHERLDDLESACEIYDHIMQKYLDYLLTTSVSDLDKVGRYIKRDLSVLIKYLQHRDDKYLGKTMLLHHLRVLQNVIYTRYPEISEFLQEQQAVLDTVVKPTSEHRPFEFIDLADGSQTAIGKKLSGVMLDDVVGLFKDELFTALDLFTQYCLQSNDVPAALRNQLMTVQLMSLANVKKSQILFSQANLGSILYLQAEKIEGVLYKLEKEKSSLENEVATDTSKDNEENYYLNLLHSNHDRYVKLSLQCFQGVLNSAEITDNFEEVLDPLSMKAAALAVYGIGVWNIHEGNLKKARKLLKESAKFAKETSFDSLLKEAEKELRKVRKMIKQEKLG